MIIQTSSYFKKSYKKLPIRIREKAKEKENIFRNNPFSPLLNTHKLKGNQKDLWAFWVSYSYRIKFIFLNDNEILFLDIGTHEIYK